MLGIWTRRRVRVTDEKGEKFILLANHASVNLPTEVEVNLVNGDWQVRFQGGLVALKGVYKVVWEDDEE